MREGNGPLRTVETVNSRPICPPSIRRRISCSAGLKRSTWPTAPATPARAHSSTIERAASPEEASGFSISIATPASASDWATGRWSSVGTATIAKSTAPPPSSAEVESKTSAGSCTAR